MSPTTRDHTGTVPDGVFEHLLVMEGALTVRRRRGRLDSGQAVLAERLRVRIGTLWLGRWD
jgi:hypothetical protein